MSRKLDRRQFALSGAALAAAIGGAGSASGAGSSAAAIGTASGGAGQAATGSRTRARSDRTLRVVLLDERGKSVPQSRRKTLYVADLHFEPERRRISVAPDGTVEINVSIPRAVLHARITVPGFGNVWVAADNEGEGYDRPRATIDFVREAARGRLADIDRLTGRSKATFSAECMAHRDAAREFMALAAKTTGPKAARFHMAALSHGLWAGELAVVEHARHVIASRPPRKGFLLGCNAFKYRGPTPYADYFRTLLNYATLPFYLGRLEPQEGRPDYSRVDEILQWCEKAAIRPKGHPLWWGHEAGIPRWLKGADWAEARKHCERVVGRSVERYRGRIDTWDVINEAHDWANGLRLTQEQEIEITRICCETARSKNPRAMIIVNNCCPFGRYAADGRVHLGPVYERVMTPLRYLERLLEAQVDFDVIGVQLYNPGTDMLTINKLLDEYARFGKTVHITELGVRSEDGRRGGVGEWHQPWSEKVQADWLEWFYTIAYSRREIEAITWWDFRDPAFIPTGGFLRRDETPREIYFRLKALKRSWRLES